MLKEFVVNLCVLTTCLFLFRQWYGFTKPVEQKTRWIRFVIGIISGILGIVLMSFSVQVNNSVLLDMRHMTILIASNAGGILAALVTATLVSVYRYLMYGGYSQAFLVSVIAMFSIALGTSIIRAKVLNFWKRWGSSIVWSCIVLGYAFYVLDPADIIAIGPYFIGMYGAGGIFVMYIIHFFIRSRKSEIEARIAKQELHDILRLQKGLTFKFRKEEDTFVYTMGDGQLIYQFGLDPQEMVGKSIRELFSHEKETQIRPFYERAWAGHSVSYESVLNGFTYYISLTPVEEKGGIKEVIATGVDITELKRTETFLRESEERFRLIASHSGDLISKHMPDGTFTFLSPACETLLGYRPEELIGKTPTELYHPDDWEQVVESHMRAMKGPESIVLEFRFRKKNGQYIWLESTTNAVRSPNGRALEIVSNTRDITDRKSIERQLLEANERLHRLSYTDGLTGIGNRRYFDRLLAEVQEPSNLNNKQVQHCSVSMILLDIDDFKKYNDTYGHQEGDGCLIRVAETIQSVLQPYGLTAIRYGGEEFAVWLPNLSGVKADEIAESLRSAIQALAIPHCTSQVQGTVTISLGVATATYLSVENLGQLISMADQALYQAKREGRNRVHSIELPYINIGDSI